MQERFNKDLEEIKKSKYIMNNEINDIKNTLEGLAFSPGQEQAAGVRET